MLKKNNIGILGIGAWGVALALYFSKKGYNVFLWSHETDIADEMITTNSSGPYLVGFRLPPNIFITKNIETIFNQTELIFEFIPMLFLTSILKECKKYFKPDQHILVSSTRGADTDLQLLSTDLIKNILSSKAVEIYFYGAGNPINLALHEFSIGILACSNNEVLNFVHKILNSTSFHIEKTKDINGTQICSSLQSIFLLLPKVMQESGFSQPDQTLFLAESLKEMSLLVEKMNGSLNTIYGPCGGLKNLMFATSYEKKLRFSEKIFLEETKKELHSYQVPEVTNAIISVINLASKKFDLKLNACSLVKDYLLSGALNRLKQKAYFKSVH